jgi:hypothetical protein
MSGQAYQICRWVLVFGRTGCVAAVEKRGRIAVVRLLWTEAKGNGQTMGGDMIVALS